MVRLGHEGEKGTFYFFIEGPTARNLEALGATNSTTTNQIAVFAVRDIIAAARSNGSTGSP